MIRKLLLFITLLVLSVPAFSSGWSYPDTYNSEIKSAAARYMPGVDWRLYRAQLFQESLLQTDAVSPVGASGIAQFMPATWLEVSKSLGFEGLSPQMAAPAIEAGAYYMGKMRRIWTTPRPEADRHSLAMASYNAGAGNIIKAQRAAGNPPDYASIIAALPQITGKHANETQTYVPRIWVYWQDMVINGT